MEKERKSFGLAGNILRVLSANFWVTIVGFISSLIFPQILTVDDFALYHTFTLYLSYITILHLGFPSGMVINYAGKNYNEIDRNQYRTEIKIISIVLAFFSIVFFTLSLIKRNRMLMYITLAIIPFNIVSSYKSLVQAWMQFKIFSLISTVVASAIPGLALLYYVIIGILPGDVYISIYLLVYWIATVFIIIESGKKVKGAKSNKIITEENWNTEKTGIAIVLGNYIHTLLISVDKQFVKWFFDTSRFAFYSFGISMQALMNVFITSIAQPLFPAMAQGRFKDKEYNLIKELLLLFGSLSGCAYFAASFIVKNFIPKYIDSLDIVGIYFVAFPVMAVVNCLYINLYKIKNLMKKYIITLGIILMIAVILNLIVVKVYFDYRGVSIATTITYYIWFFLGFKQFRFLKLRFKDVIYLLLYTVFFFLITRIVKNEFIGMAVYLIFLTVLVLIFYRNEVKPILNYIRR